MEGENNKLKSDNAVLRTLIQSMKLEMRTEKDSIKRKLKEVKKGQQITLDDGNTLSLTPVTTENAATLLEATVNIFNQKTTVALMFNWKVITF